MEGINDWMRFKRTITIAAIVVALCGCTCGIAGCSESASATEENVVSYRLVMSDVPENATFADATIITDTETGCQYLFVYRSKAGGVTLLVDEDGNPIIDQRYAKDGD